MSVTFAGSMEMEFTCAPYSADHPVQVTGLFNGSGVDTWCPTCGYISPTLIEVLTGSARELAEALRLEAARSEALAAFDADTAAAIEGIVDAAMRVKIRTVRQ